MEINIKDLEKEKKAYEEYLEQGGEPTEVRVRMMPGPGPTINLQVRVDNEPSTVLLKMFVGILKEKVIQAVNPNSQASNRN
jgi:hypothetical protein